MTVVAYESRVASPIDARLSGSSARRRMVGVVSVLLGFCGAAQAETLSVEATADNDFSIYVSDSPSVLGRLVLTDGPNTGSNWVNTYSGSTTLGAGENYINIVAENLSGPAGMIASFTIGSKTFYTSDNGSWKSAYVPGGGGYAPNNGAWVSDPTGSVVSFGATNNAYWYAEGAFPHTNINPSAEWIWANDPVSFPGTSPEPYNNACTGCTVEFSAAVPEASTWSMLVLGFGGLGFAGYLRMRKDASIVSAA